MKYTIVREFEVWQKNGSYKAGPVACERGEEIFTGPTALEAGIKFVAFELGADWMLLQSGEIVFGYREEI